MKIIFAAVQKACTLMCSFFWNCHYVLFVYGCCVNLEEFHVISNCKNGFVSLGGPFRCNFGMRKAPRGIQ